MAEKKGWIHLHRKIQDCILWESQEPFDCRSAWIDLILLANHEDKRMIFDGQPITVKKGQRITSVRVLAQRWHWGNNKTLKYLRMLEEENMIIRDSDKRRTLLTIVNYEVYNDTINTDEYTDGTETEQQRNTDGTLTEHCRNTDEAQTRIIKNDKNEKNEENNIIPPTPLKRGRTKKESNLVLLDEIFKRNPQTVLPDDVVAVLKEWMEYKDQRKEHYVEKGMKSLLRQAYESTNLYGASAVMECIRDSMASNYQGVIWDRLKRNPTTQKISNQQKSLDQLAEYGKQFLEGEEE